MAEPNSTPDSPSNRGEPEIDPADSFLVWLVTNRVTTWLIRKIASTR